METIQKDEQAASNKSNLLNEDSQKDQAIQKESNITSQKIPATDNDKPTGAEKERKGNEHEHSYKTPVAKPDVEEENQRKNAEQDIKENQSSK
ncbi:MAG TPA: hypothetical protein VK783_12785 [Bacteroidia bacterium]|jgi:hypothetical protein|nr:hypothetical protein [Bacteroidia bacterium]